LFVRRVALHVPAVAKIKRLPVGLADKLTTAFETNGCTLSQRRSLRNVESIDLRGDKTGTGEMPSGPLIGRTPNALVSRKEKVDDADLDDLGEGQTLIQTYDLTVEDNDSGTAVRTVAITITGRADAPTGMVIDMTGHSEGVMLTGGLGNDALTGDNGADTINGGPGADMLIGSAGNDTFVFAKGEAAGDTVADFVSGADQRGGTDRYS
jgi:Ca2+-binding RTX toxin-like protein